jgi:hypoxanthine phosphoribosyltransferase
MNMKNKMILTWDDARNLTAELVRQMSVNDWSPTRVVGISRGGLTTAAMLSHYYAVPLTALHVSLRNHQETESNCALAEAAFGYCNEIPEGFDFSLREQILIVDDICDSGSTQQWIKQDWMACCLPNHSAWNSVWNNNVRFAALVHNLGSTLEIDYAGQTIDKREKDVWVEFPWENWWRT